MNDYRPIIFQATSNKPLDAHTSSTTTKCFPGRKKTNTFF